MEDPQWSSVFLKDCTLWKGRMLEQFVKNCSTKEGPTLEKFMEDCFLWEGPHAGAGEENKEEGAAEMTCDALTATPIPRSPVPLGRKEVEYWGVKLSLEEGRGGGKVF